MKAEGSGTMNYDRNVLETTQDMWPPLEYRIRHVSITIRVYRIGPGFEDS